MLGLILRKFRNDDILPMMRIISETFNEYYDSVTLLDIYNSWPSGTIIASFNNEVVGFVLGSLPAPQEARILILVVDKNYRRRGVGSRLLNAFTQECIRIGIKSIRLEVRVINEIAIKFYRKFGFAVTATLPYYYSDGTDGYLMRKFL